MAITTRETTATGVTNKGSPLTNSELDTNFVELQQDKLENIVEDTTPQLGGSLDVNGNAIVSLSNANIAITPNGSGIVQLDGNVDVQSGEIALKNSGSVSNIKLYCEVSNAHYTQLQSSAHGAYSGNVTLTLPAATDTLVGKATTDTFTNKSGNISQWTNDSGYTTNTGTVTPSSTDTFTNKSGNISQWTNDSGYLTSYTETDTLDSVTGRGATTTNSISVGGLTVDTDTLHVDSTNNRVGIGTTVPQTTTHIKGPTTSDLSDLGDGTLYVQSSETATTEKGAVLALGGHYSGTTGEVPFGYVSGVKDSSGIAGNLVFHTRASGSSTPEVMRLTYDGKVLIGQASAPTTTPSALMDLYRGTFVTRRNDDQYIEIQNIDSSGSQINFRSATSNAKGVYYNCTTDTSNTAKTAGALEHHFQIRGTTEMLLQEDGDLHVDGDVIAYSTTISDQRLKDDVETIDSALDKVSNLRGVTYTWSAGSREGKRDLGVIAQEVEAVIPEIVHEKQMALIDGESYKTVDYEKLTAVLIEAVKELKAEVDALKAAQ